MCPLSEEKYDCTVMYKYVTLTQVPSLRGGLFKGLL